MRNLDLAAPGKSEIIYSTPQESFESFLSTLLSPFRGERVEGVEGGTIDPDEIKKWVHSFVLVARTMSDPIIRVRFKAEVPKHVIAVFDEFGKRLGIPIYWTTV